MLGFGFAVLSRARLSAWCIKWQGVEMAPCPPTPCLREEGQAFTIPPTRLGLFGAVWDLVAWKGFLPASVASTARGLWGDAGFGERVRLCQWPASPSQKTTAEESGCTFCPFSLGLRFQGVSTNSSVSHVALVKPGDGVHAVDRISVEFMKESIVSKKVPPPQSK